jgi:hypothetical protein
MTDEAQRGELPLPDYDHLPLGSLASRLRSLDAAGLETLLGYERAHGNRVPVVQVLETPLAEIAQGAQPAGGSPQALRPEAAPAPTSDASASPATSGPAMNPPSHGDPTNPAQPRSTG